MATMIPRTFNTTPDFHAPMWSSNPYLNQNDNSEFITLYCYSYTMADKKRKLEHEEEEEKEVEEAEMSGKSRQFQPFSILLNLPDPPIRIPSLITSIIDLLSYDSLSEGDEQEGNAEGGVEGRDEMANSEPARKRHASESAMSVNTGELASLLILVLQLTEPCNNLYDVVVLSDTPAQRAVSTASILFSAGLGQPFRANLRCVGSRSGGNCSLFGGKSRSRKYRYNINHRRNARDFSSVTIFHCPQPVFARACICARVRAHRLFKFCHGFIHPLTEPGGKTGDVTPVISENEEANLLQPSPQKKLPKKRSAEAKKRRNLKSRGKMRAKREARRPANPKIAVTVTHNSDGAERVIAAHPAKPATTKTRPRTTTTSTAAPARYVEVSRPAGNMVEADRRRILSVLAVGLTTPGPSSETDGERPLAVDLSGVKLHKGSVRIGTSNLSDQARVMVALAALRGEFTITEGRAAPRYIIGLPGYMADLGAERAVLLLEMQNSGLPRGGLRQVSLFRGRGAGNQHPVLFVDATEEAVQYLATVNFSLRTLTSTVGVRPAGPRDPNKQQ